jgi:hypothetical protein
MSDLPPRFRLSRVLLVSLGIGTALTCLSIVLDHDDFPPVLVRGWPVPFVSWDSTPGATLDFGVYALPLAYDVIVWAGLCFFAACMGMTVWITAVRWRRERRHAAKVCVTCGYSLTGNVSGICPECGTPVRTSETRQGRVPMTWVKCGAAALGVLVVLWVGAGSGGRCDCCALCGARSREWTFSVYGLGGKYGRSVREGLVSETIQAFDRSPCKHTWELAYRRASYGLQRLGGAGKGLRRYWWVGQFEINPAAPQFLRYKMGQDAGFGAAFQQAIRGGRHDVDSNLYLDSLLYELGEFRPAAMASQPAG